MTSANVHGGPDPAQASRTFRRRSYGRPGAVVDVGELPGTPSTVIDLTGKEPEVLRVERFRPDAPGQNRTRDDRLTALAFVAG